MMIRDVIDTIMTKVEDAFACATDTPSIPSIKEATETITKMKSVYSELFMPNPSLGFDMNSTRIDVRLKKMSHLLKKAMAENGGDATV